tara:strand:- start:857 stop:1315 length:459 start_codon:yes stop_codon:yes gene_type:complete
MDDNTIKIIELEQHETKDVNDGHINGVLTVLWRDWDKIIPINPKMIYISSVKPNEKKGPHLHKKRNSYFICIKGKLAFVIKQKNGTYEEIIVSSDKPKLIVVPKEYASAHINLSETNSEVLVLADIAWKPNDDEMENLIFENYDWSKWKLKE